MTLAALQTVLAGLGVGSGVREAIVGDLIEEHSRFAARDGSVHADRWLRRQVIGSIPFFARETLRTGGLRLIATTLLSALGALIAVGLLNGVSVIVLSALIGPNALERLGVVALTVDLVFGAAGGNVAARFGRLAPLCAALVFGVFGIVVTAILGAAMDAWYRLSLELLIVPATLGGGWLHARGLVARARS